MRHPDAGSEATLLLGRANRAPPTVAPHGGGLEAGMTFVGAGKGAYVTEVRHRFVGDGGGDFALVAPPAAAAPGSCYRCCGRACGACSLILLAVLGYMPRFAGVYVKPLYPAQTAPLVRVFGDTSLGWWNMPVPQPTATLDELHARLDPLPWPERVTEDSAGWMRRGVGPADVVMRAMFEATKLPGVFERTPEKLRGVFWMKGNGAPEELAVLQHGQWFEEQKMFVVPMAPFNWGWPAGKPKSAPFDGVTYTSLEAVREAPTVMGLAVLGTTLSFAFSDHCEGTYCLEDGGNLTDAYMQSSIAGDLQRSVATTDIFSAVLDVPQGLVSGAFTLQEMPGSVQGSRWKRTCHWGVPALGPRAFAEFGTYELVKVLDGEGRPVEPYYSEFVEYMGGVPLAVWSGFEDEASRQRATEKYAEYAQNSEAFLQTALPWFRHR